KIDSNINLFPNPVTGLVNIQYFGIDPAQASLYDMSGRLITEMNILNSGVYKINMLGLAKAIYVLEIKDHVNNSKFRRLLVKL
ncbi:MAG TPA: T9SS type A sorting domain-containing protein, partial [Chitinophagaceae bacterium]